MEKKKNAVLTDEIRRSVILFRLFGKKIPKEYHLDLIRSGEYDCKFFTKFIKKHVLSRECIAVFVDKYWSTARTSKNNFFEVLYMAINTYSDISYWVLDVFKKSTEVDVAYPDKYQNPECFIRITPELIDEIFAIEDINILKRFFDYICLPVGFHHITEKAIREKNMAVLKALSVDNNQIGSHEIDLVFKSGDKDIIEFIVQNVGLPDWAERSLLTNKKYIDIAKKYIACHILDDLTISKLILKGNKQLLAIYISRVCLSTNMQYELADAGMYDLLKLHYKKYGTNRDVVNYVANLDVYKEKLGI